MTRIVVTEITRFANRDIVCSAGIDTEGGQCYRVLVGVGPAQLVDTKAKRGGNQGVFGA